VNCLPLARMVTLKSGMGNSIENNLMTIRDDMEQSLMISSQ